MEKKDEGYNVYILDASAAFYMIPIGVYNKDFDMFMIGNFGARGEEGLIERLDEKENTMLLILNENHRRNWQNPETVRRHILQNWRFYGERGQFDIYYR